MVFEKIKTRKDVYTQHTDGWKKWLDHDYFIEQNEILEYDNALVLPPINKVEGNRGGEKLGGIGILNSTNKPTFIAGFFREKPSFQNTYPGWNGIADTYPVNKDDIEFCDESVIFGGVLIGHFGHFILESMSRLWYVFENPNDNRSIIFIIAEGERKWFNDFFNLLGISNRIKFISKVTQFSHITIPEESVHSWSSYSSKYFIPYQKICSNIHKDSTNTPKKVYLTHRQYKGPVAIVGEEIFEKFYKNLGFEIVAPEKLSIKEQISLIANAEEIACSMGSLAHFVMFMQATSRIHLLLRETHQVVKPVCLQLAASKIDYAIVDVSQNFFMADRAYGVCLIGCTPDFCRYAKEYFDIDLKPQLEAQHTLEYVTLWTEIFTNEQKFDKPHVNRITQWRGIDWVNSLSQTLLNKPIPESIKNKWLLKEQQVIKEKDNSNYIFNLYKNIFSKELIIDLHISRIGWIEGLPVNEQTNNSSINTIEALRIHSQENLNFEYCCEHAGNWGAKVKRGEISGITGRSIPITGFALYLDEKTAKQYEIFYRIADNNGKWSNWTHDGNKVSINVAVCDIAFKIIRR